MGRIFSQHGVEPGLVLAGDLELSVRHLCIEQRTSKPFTITVRARSDNHGLELDRIVGQDAGVSLPVALSHAPQNEQRFEGLCCYFEQERAEPDGLSTYLARVVPKLWLLTQRRDYRVFQHQSAPDIVREILDRWQIDAMWSIDRARYPMLHYRVQYGESDYDFVARLLEEVGIAFCWLPDDGGTFRLHFADHLDRRPPRPPLRFCDEPNEVRDIDDYVTAVSISHEIRPSAVLLHDVDHRRPHYPIVGAAHVDGAIEHHVYEPGASVVETEPDGLTPVADRLAAERHDDAWADQRAARQLRALRSERRRITFATNAADLHPGAVFHVLDHPHRITTPLLVVGRTLRGGPTHGYTIEGVAVFADERYAPPVRSDKPVAQGVQSATVVGPEGEEIHCDELGRVRVQFPWDRGGTMNEHSSCWLRVSQGWAGTGYGQIVIPRVGQEVLVGFLQGDPDQPIVVGRVFNATQPVPHDLPANKTRSTWKSQSSPAAEGFNEIMFEDAAERELVWIRAQRDMRTFVKQDATITIGGNHRRLVKGDVCDSTIGRRNELTRGDRIELIEGDSTVVVEHDRSTLIGATENVRIEGDRVVRVGGDDHAVIEGECRAHIRGDDHLRIDGNLRQSVAGGSSLTVQGDLHQRVGQHLAVDVGSSIHMQAATGLVIEADDLTIAAAGGFIRIDAGGVTISGDLVKINSGGSAGGGAGCSPVEPGPPLQAEVPAMEPPEAADLELLGIEGAI